jgi:hypothetical protein
VRRRDEGVDNVEGGGDAFAEGVESVLFHGLNPEARRRYQRREARASASRGSSQRSTCARTPEAAGAVDGQRVFCLKNDIYV